MANTEVLSDYLAEAALATQLEMSPRTLQRWRRLRTGPTPTMIGNKIYYHVDDLKVWLRAQRQESAA